jgi:hypothetical protein
MTFRWRSGRILRVAGVAVLALVAVLAAYVQIQQHILRWRAERLLADIREIQMGKSTWADAQRLMTRWGAWGAWQGDCTERYCDFEISLDDSSGAFHHFPLLRGGNWGPELRWPRFLDRLYFWAGGRFAVVAASFTVRHGFIQEKSFGVQSGRDPKVDDPKNLYFDAPDSVLSARVLCDTGLLHWGFFSASDPEVSLFNADDDRQGHAVFAQFTPFADDSEVRMLMDFNLDCLTRRKECRTTGELLPSAVSLFEKKREDAKRTGQVRPPNDLPLWITARDTAYVAIGEVVQTPQSAALDGLTLPMLFQVKELLKGESEIGVSGSFFMAKTVGSNEICLVPANEARKFSKGTKVIMAFDGQLNQDREQEADLSTCVVAPLEHFRNCCRPSMQ